MREVVPEFNKTIPFENYFYHREVFKINFVPGDRDWIRRLAKEQSRDPHLEVWKLYSDALDIEDRLAEAYEKIDQNAFSAAMDILKNIEVFNPKNNYHQIV